MTSGHFMDTGLERWKVNIFCSVNTESWNLNGMQLKLTQPYQDTHVEKPWSLDNNFCYFKSLSLWKGCYIAKKNEIKKQ